MTVDTPSLASLSARWRRFAERMASDPNVPGAAVMVYSMCADELDALQRQLLKEKDNEDSLTRMVNPDPLTLKTPRPPDR